MAVPKAICQKRRVGEALDDSARVKMVRESVIILQCTVGKERPTNAEIEICAMKLCYMVPEFKDPTPPNMLDFKPYVGFKALLLYMKFWYQKFPD